MISQHFDSLPNADNFPSTAPAPVMVVYYKYSHVGPVTVPKLDSRKALAACHPVSFCVWLLTRDREASYSYRKPSVRQLRFQCRPSYLRLVRVRGFQLPFRARSLAQSIDGPCFPKPGANSDR